MPLLFNGKHVKYTSRGRAESRSYVDFQAISQPAMDPALQITHSRKRKQTVVTLKEKKEALVLFGALPERSFGEP